MREVKRSALIAAPPATLYALVADVERYPEFLPWCTHAAVRSRGDTEVIATIGIRRGLLATTLTTRNAMTPVSSVAMSLVEGPFRNLEGLWTFTPIGEAGTRIALEMRFAFANAVTAAVLEPLFEETAASMVDAFVGRARATAR